MTDRTSRTEWIHAAILITVTIVAFLPATRAGYIWDDDDHVYNNMTLRSIEGLAQIWTDIGATPQYYPLTHTTFWLEYRLWGDAPTGYHATNILLHALASVLLWRVLRRLKIPGAWLAAAIFAVHPIQVESVAWITERKNVLSGVFYLAAGLLYLRWALNRDGLAGKAYTRWLYLGAIGLFLFALMSKTIACSLPASLLIVLWWKHGRITRRDLLSVSPFFALGLGFALLTVLMERNTVGAVGVDWQYSLVERCLIAGRALFFYPSKLVWPWPLMFIYPRWAISPAVTWQYLFPVGVLLMLSALWALRNKIGRGPIAAVAFYIVTIFPALGFFNIYPMLFSFVADHFNYLACIGLIVGFLAGGELMVERLKIPRLKPVISSLVIILLMATTVHRCLAFRDAESLWRDTLKKNESAWMANNNLGLIHMNRGENDTAKAHFKEVLRLRPNEVRALNNLGSIELVEGDITGARDYFEQAIEYEPDFIGARLNLCKTLVGLGDFHAASGHYMHALRVDPAVADAEEQLALILLSALEVSAANEFFQRATHTRPGWILLINEMAWILATDPNLNNRDADRAIELASSAADLSDGRDPNILDTMAAAYASVGDYTSAVEWAAKAIELAKIQGNTALSVEIHNRLELYERSKPYLLEP